MTTKSSMRVKPLLLLSVFITDVLCSAVATEGSPIDLNDKNGKSYHHISSTQSTQDRAVRSAPHINKLSVKTAALSSNFRHKPSLIEFFCGHLGYFVTEFHRAVFSGTLNCRFHTQFSSVFLVWNKRMPYSHLPHLTTFWFVDTNANFNASEWKCVRRSRFLF